MNEHRLLSGLLATVSIMIVSVSVQAGMVNENFDGLTPGKYVGTDLPSTVGADYWSGSVPSATISTGVDKDVRFASANGNTSGAIYIGDAFATKAGTLSFDFALNKGTTGLSFGYVLFGEAYKQDAIDLRIYNDGRLYFQAGDSAFFADQTAMSGTLAFTFTTGNTWSATLNGAAITQGATTSWSHDDVAVCELDKATRLQVYTYHEDAAGGSFVIDNIVAIPEPATMCLVSIGGLATVLRKRC